MAAGAEEMPTSLNLSYDSSASSDVSADRPSPPVGNFSFQPRHDSYRTEEHGIMVFHPTLEEMADFNEYIRFMESVGASKEGVAKVIPPEGYCARREGYNLDGPIGDMRITNPIQQVINGSQGLYSVLNMTQRSMTVRRFKKLCDKPQYSMPSKCKDKDDAIEKAYWRTLAFNGPIYGADVAGTVSDEDHKIWNVRHLDTILDKVGADGAKLPGVNTPYLYYGMWKASFCWHTEDMDLYSINYIHTGMPKTWYAIRPGDASKFDAVVNRLFEHEHRACRNFTRHKTSMIAPHVLAQHGVRVAKTVHRAGEFMITFPRGYHAGFNHGFNIAESTNFASDRWIDYGLEAVPCLCRGDTVRIDMDVFLKHFRPALYRQRLKEREEAAQAERKRRIALGLPSDSDDSDDSTEDEEKPKRKVLKKPKRTVVKGGGGQLAAKKQKSDPNDPKALFAEECQHNHQTAILPDGRARCCVCQRVGNLNPAVRARLAQQAQILHHKQRITQQLQQPDISPELRQQLLGQLAKLPAVTDPSAAAATPANPASNPSHFRLGPGEALNPQLPPSQRPSPAGQPTFQPTSASSMPNSCSSKPCAPRPTPSLAAPSSSAHTSWPKPTSNAACSSTPCTSSTPSSSASSCSSSNASGSSSLPHNSSSSSKPASLPALHNRDFQLVSPLPNPSQSSSKANISTSNNDGAAARVGDESAAAMEVSSDHDDEFDEGQLDDHHAVQSSLFRCNTCAIVVHRGCYGIPAHASAANWQCDRCVQGLLSVRCALCPNLGGAYKPVAPWKQSSDNKEDETQGGPAAVSDEAAVLRKAGSTGAGPPAWAHVVCGLWVPEATFGDTATLSPIDISLIPKDRYKLKCTLCKGDSKHALPDMRYKGKLPRMPDVSRDGVKFQRTGAPIQCTKGKCVRAFHPICARRHKYYMKLEAHPDGSSAWNALCQSHRPKDVVPEDAPPVVEGQSVFARYNDRKYYPGTVVKIGYTTYCKVRFTDGSEADHVAPSTITAMPDPDDSDTEGSVAEQAMTLHPGQPVVVRWTAASTYQATFVEYTRHEKYSIEFDDGYSIAVERHHVRVSQEKVPKGKLGKTEAKTDDEDKDGQDVAPESPEQTNSGEKDSKRPRRSRRARRRA
eukprot:TRINITY_DN10895_c0_g1_i3.p1 TRINITY_DN10895_c0_g1~~TRINITY_DN10895_c0_g1_i3.p1  ORF type:complete len:1127 (+),score=288.84 TRINITY_DN10895_c0_g1_i3:198-3578(+)